jgi:hypothetical protein
MIKKLFLLLLLGGGAVFFGSAFTATAKFRDALERKDAKAVEELVDWPALQASVKEQLREMTKTFMTNQFGAKVDTPEFDRELDARLTQSMPKLNAFLLIRDAKKRIGKPDAKELVIEGRSWAPLRDFKMRFAGDATVMRFRFVSGGWKLVGLEADEADAQKMLKAQFAAEMQAAQPVRR